MSGKFMGQQNMSNTTTQPDPFSTPTIFLRIGWMTRYQGQTTSDHIRGGGAFVEEHGYGHEIFNFQPFEGKFYGYRQPPRSGHNQPKGPGININRLGADADDESGKDAITHQGIKSALRQIEH